MSMNGNYVRVSSARLAELRATPDTIMDFLYPDDLAPPENHLDIDKTWHAIHFLLTGQAWGGEPPLLNAVLGGKPIGDIDVGYGPARALESEDLRVLAAALADISSNDLLARFDPGALNSAEIYPGGWSDEGKGRAHIAQNYERLVDFIRSAADAGDAVIEYLN